MTEQFDIDSQIDTIEREIAEYSKRLFEAQGMLRMALHIKKKCNLTPKEEKIASRSPARQ